MKPKVKALELIDRFTLEGNYLQKFDDSKAQALICVDEIVQNNLTVLSGESYHRELNYWQEVKSIIQEM